MNPLIEQLREKATEAGPLADLLTKAADELERLVSSRRRNLAATVEKASPEAIAKFWAQVDQSGGPDACWPWMGRCNKDGYGHVWIGGKSDKRAHRVACALMGRVQPPDTVADHSCRERSCCNPAHIEFIPQGENVRKGDSPFSINARKIECSKGHPLSGENLALKPGKRPGNQTRICLTCYPGNWRFAVIPREPPRRISPELYEKRYGKRDPSAP